MRYGWSLDEIDWVNLQRLLTDTKWNRAYLETVFKDRIPNESGIYIICSNTVSMGNLGPAVSSLNNAIYVGQSTNLKNRFTDHVNGYGNVVKAKLIFRRLEYWWTLVDSEKLNLYEQVLVNALGPSANEVNVIKAKIGQPLRI
jgi:excinuclease UvrABC nuclease subunit